MIPFTPRSCRITVFCDVPKAQMPLAILNIGFARRAAFVWVQSEHSNLIGITQTVDTCMQFPNTTNETNFLASVTIKLRRIAKKQVF